MYANYTIIRFIFTCLSMFPLTYNLKLIYRTNDVHDSKRNEVTFRLLFFIFYLFTTTNFIT